ncbi:MAG: DnaD domain protein [Eubacteriales bacterium]|nr:DnaD domain protein [Eubacteriales bacterium]
MNFTKQKTKDLYLKDSHLENIFINEYLPAAPGDYVKVFVYASMYAEAELAMNNQTMAEQLGIDEKTVADAWEYWESMGAVRRSYSAEAGIEPAVEFISLKELMYAPGDVKPEETQEEPDLSGSEKKEMFDTIERMFGRTLSSSEVGEFLDWMDEERISKEMILFAAEYSLKRGKDSVKYISRVLHTWEGKGLHTKEDVENYLEETDKRHNDYRTILRELGFTRNATAQEKRMMDSWLDDMGYSMSRILEACGKTAGISNPNFNYVNRVLENWKNEAEKNGNDINDSDPVTQSDLKRYYEYLRKKEEKEADERLREVYRAIPKIVRIDEENRTLNTSLTKLLLSGGGPEAEAMKKKIDSLAEERAFLLAEHDYNIDYTDVRYCCDKCRDTGITDSGERCSCAEERMREAAEWKKTQKQE